MASGNCNVTMVNNTIVYNSTQTNGGGICTLYPGSTISGRNNIIFYNTSSDNTQYSSIGGGGASTLTYSCISQDMSGIGNIMDEPMFVNAAEDDFHLQDGSPCIDAGDPASPSDPDGTRADIGAFYYDQSTGVGGSVSPSMFEMFPVCPNPAFSGVTISCRAPQAGNLRIIIYDITGREVLVLIDQFTASGLCSVLWDGKNSAGQRVESGVYFCRCEFDGAAQSKQLILIGD